MYYNNIPYNNGDRFLVPFLLGGLAGGAVVGLSRPRPVYVNQATPYSQGPYFNSSYSYYTPYYY
jgi:hypothetical protein